MIVREQEKIYLKKTKELFRNVATLCVLQQSKVDFDLKFKNHMDEVLIAENQRTADAATYRLGIEKAESEKDREMAKAEFAKMELEHLRQRKVEDDKTEEYGRPSVNFEYAIRLKLQEFKEVGKALESVFDEFEMELTDNMLTLKEKPLQTKYLNAIKDKLLEMADKYDSDARDFVQKRKISDEVIDKVYEKISYTSSNDESPISGFVIQKVLRPFIDHIDDKTSGEHSPKIESTKILKLAFLYCLGVDEYLTSTFDLSKKEMHKIVSHICDCSESTAKIILSALNPMTKSSKRDEAKNARDEAIKILKEIKTIEWGGFQSR